MAENARYGFADGSGKRASIRFASGAFEKGIRHAAERLHAEYTAAIGASKPGVEASVTIHRWVCKSI